MVTETYCSTQCMKQGAVILGNRKKSMKIWLNGLSYKYDEEEMRQYKKEIKDVSKHN